MGRISTAKSALIFHGTKGSPESNWFPWLREQLIRRGISVVVPQLPTPEGQSLKAWRDACHAQCGVPDRGTLLIGHSLGATFILRLLEQLQHPVCGSVFVAGFLGNLGLEEFDRLNSSFIAGPFDWSTIKLNAGAVVCLSGEADPYVSDESSCLLASHLGVSNQQLAHGGHLNTESGYSTFPQLEKVLEQEGFIGPLW